MKCRIKFPTNNTADDPIFGIIYSELLTFFDSGKSETSLIASLNSGLFLGCGKFVQKQCLFLCATIFKTYIDIN
jgi:hypothetical protein